MYALTIRIEPEQELYRFIDDNDTIRTYCTGEKGLLLYPSFENSNLANLIGEDISLVEDLASSSPSLHFNCDCVTNPPSKIRQIISKFNATIVNPIVLKNNWEYMTVIVTQYEDIEHIRSEIENFYRVEVLKIENIDVGTSYMHSNSIKELINLLTKQQRDTLIRAWKKGYYKIPRNVKTEELAQEQQITRYALEKKLRVAENKVMENIIPLFILSSDLNDNELSFSPRNSPGKMFTWQKNVE